MGPAGRRTGPEVPAGPIAGPVPDLLPNLDRTQKPDRLPMAIFLKFGVLRVANVNSWHIDFQVNRTNRFRDVANGIWLIFFIYHPLLYHYMTKLSHLVQKCTSVELRLSQSAHSPTPGGRGRTSRTSSGRNFRPDVPVRSGLD